jgi:hypothetical protein
MDKEFELLLLEKMFIRNVSQNRRISRVCKKPID